MPRNPSKILSVAEAKSSALDKKIAEAMKASLAAKKVYDKAEVAVNKLLERRAKAEEKRLGATPSET